MVPEARFELARGFPQRGIRPPRLPVPPLPLGAHRSGRSRRAAGRGILRTMYVPDYFRPTEADVRALLDHLDAADLITATDDGLLSTFLPLIFEPPGSSPDAGELGRLMGHVARNNRQWKVPAIGDAMVIVRGPEAYISPAWYATKREHGRVVPTWNYITAHIHGRLLVHEEGAWLE